MSFEIESKYSVDEVDAFLARAKGLSLAWGEPTLQIDRYLAHPCRDFRQTGEAFRLRVSGDELLVTYKGPRQAHAVKTRKEIELPLASDATKLEEYATLFQLLGFEAVAEVRKSRRKAKLREGDAEIEICLDEVDELGTFAEFEALADEANVAEAQERVTKLAARFDLGEPEPRSYLRMLLERRGEG